MCTGTFFAVLPISQTTLGRTYSLCDAEQRHSLHSDSRSSRAVKADHSMYLLSSRIHTETIFTRTFPPFTLAQNNPSGPSHNISVPLSVVLILQSTEMNHKCDIYLENCHGDENQLNLLSLLNKYCKVTCL